MRGSTHCHGLTKLRDNPELCKLSETALNLHNEQQMLSSSNFELQQFDNLERAVHEGKVAQDEISSELVVLKSSSCSSWSMQSSFGYFLSKSTQVVPDKYPFSGRLSATSELITMFL